MLYPFNLYLRQSVIGSPLLEGFRRLALEHLLQRRLDLVLLARGLLGLAYGERLVIRARTY